MPLTRLLVANRGEIAVRVMQAAADIGLASVAVHADDDAESGHVKFATEVLPLKGSGPSAYLDVEQVVGAALTAGCDALHPGYGFLSENPAFALACARAGIRFVGPRPEVLELFGDKARARAHVAELGIPVLRGTSGQTTLDEAAALLHSLEPGAGLMVKAVAGGGGRGIRPVYRAEDLADAFARCASEAASAFGDGSLYVEELLSDARHVEVQLVGDGRDLSHLWDRDCSIQRRRQKLVEIAPAPALDIDVRDRLLAAAVAIGRSVDYDGIGTVEFLVSGGELAFLEVNPRIQVEHTVTEEVTGVDLVATQLRLADGASLRELGLHGSALPRPRGTAVQLRVNAEMLRKDASVHPAAGVLTAFRPPTGRGVRVDTHATVGARVTPRYDSLLAKIVVSDPDGDLRRVARRASRALLELVVEGVSTNVQLLHAVLRHDRFLEGAATTRFVDDHVTDLIVAAPLPPTGAAADVDAGSTGVAAPLQGVVVELFVLPGDEVLPGTAVAVLEAMKMEHPVVAGVAGTVERILVEPGALVDEGAVLVLVAEGDVDATVTETSEALDPELVRPDLAEVIDRHRIGLDEARGEEIARRHATGQRTARENIEDLCDEGTFVEYGALMVAGQRRRRSLEDLIRRTPADGLVAGIGDVDGRRCVVMSYDYTVLAGTQGLQNHRKTDRMIAIAERHELPVVLFAEGGGGRPGDTDTFAVASLDLPTFEAFARLSGTVPLVGIVAGYCFAGNAALAACCDVIIATEDANLAMGGPAMIRGGGLGDVAPKDIGPMSMQSRNGVVDVLVADEEAAVDAARQYLSYFDGPADGPWTAADQRRMRHLVPANRLRSYDVRPIIETIADDGSVFELRPRFGVGIVTALVRIEGRPVGVFANDTRHLGGAIDADGADKAARFIHLCDAFGLPAISLCDTPGFMVGNDAERTATIRHFGRMFVAGANARIPVLMVVLRKAYGLGPVAMAAGGLKAPMYTVAWPTGEFGGMGLEGAVELGYRRELEAIDDPRARRTRYEELVGEMYERGKALSAATAFEIDDVIDPADTRRVLAHALGTVGAPGPGGRRDFVDPW